MSDDNIHWEAFTGSYGEHFDQQKGWPTCALTGSICDACWEDRRIKEQEQFNKNIKALKIKVPEVDFDPVPIVPDFKYESVYELTLTTTKDDPYELRAWLHKIMGSNIFGVVYWEAAFELQKNGNPHIHAIMYSSKKYIDCTKVKALKFPYRYQHKRVKSLVGYNNYIRKEKDCPLLIDYCQKKGIVQFWTSKDGL